MQENQIECPGCKALLPNRGLGLDPRYHAAGECVQLYEELTAENIMKQDQFFIHQLAVDAYAAQHAGKNMKPITIIFALVGLYLFNEHGYTGRQVQQAHRKLAKHRVEWPYVEPPNQSDAMNVAGILTTADEGDQRDERIKKWSESVWKSWAHKHEWAAQICREYHL